MARFPIVAELQAKADAAIAARDASNPDRREPPGMRHESVGRAYRDAAKMAADFLAGPFAVLVVNHRFGLNVSIHTDADKARVSLAKWCREYWVPRGRKMPESGADVISAYFDHMGDRGESYAIEKEAKFED